MPRKRGHGLHARPVYNQSAKIIAKFGGEVEFAKALGISRITAYRWGYSPPVGTDGLVPSSKVEQVLRAARHHGIVLTDADWRIERINYPTEEDAA